MLPFQPISPELHWMSDYDLLVIIVVLEFLSVLLSLWLYFRDGQKQEENHVEEIDVLKEISDRVGGEDLDDTEKSD